ncbi:MAG: FAD-dependent oxidoreductase, partial [Anaerolineae bacterium]
MNAVERFDAVIIGSGQSGTPLSRALAEAGWKVALVEREHVAGTCINEGCTPTKTMVASARAAYVARRSEVYGVHTGSTEVNMVEVRQRKRDIVERFRTSNRQRLFDVGVDLVEGEARFVAPRRVEVTLNKGGTRILEGDKVIINTGARPFIPPIEGLDEIPYLNSTTIMELAEVPEHLLVMGGGYVGLEFGQMFRRFGSEVTIVQRGGQVLSREDTDVAEAVMEILREDGIEVVVNTEATRVEQAEDGSIRLIAEGPEGERVFTSSHLLVATGRTPNTEVLNLEAAGVETTERGHVVVNDRLETTAPHVYATGDVKG